jgi:hypothetical protein
MIRSPNANSSQDELEQFPFGVGEDGKDILKANVVKARVKPLPSRNPKTRIPNWRVPGEGPIWVERLAIVENFMDVLVGLDPPHLQQTIGEREEITLTTLRAIQWLPEVTHLTLGAVKNGFDASKILESGNVLQRLKTGRIVDALHRRRCRGLKNAVVDVLCAFAKLNRVEVGFEKSNAFAVEFRQCRCCGAVFALFVLFETLASWFAFFCFCDNAYRLGVTQRPTTVTIRHVVSSGISSIAEKERGA